MWDNSDARFEFNDQLFVKNGISTDGDVIAGYDLKARASVSINYDGPSGAGWLYFYTDGTPTGAYLNFDYDANKSFFFNYPLIVDGELTVNSTVTANIASGSSFRTLSTLDNEHVGGTLTSIGNITTKGTVTANTTSGSIFKTLTSYGNVDVGGVLASKDHIRGYKNIYVDYDNNSSIAGAILYFGGTSASLKWIGGAFQAFILNKPITINGTTTLGGTATFTSGVLNASIASGSIFRTLTSLGNVSIGGTLGVAGLVQCDSFRLDQTPATATIVPDKTITVSCNGVNYKIAVKAA
jgi:hypothetical protein